LKSLSGWNWNGLPEEEQKIRCRPMTHLLSKRIGDAVPDNGKLLKLEVTSMVFSLFASEKKDQNFVMRECDLFLFRICFPFDAIDQGGLCGMVM